jgi:Tfp pilus assembly protein PilF
MDSNLNVKDRNIIPRWRDFKTTITLGELGPSTLHDSELPLPRFLIEDQLKDWQANRSLTYATDLVGAALVTGHTAQIRDAVDFILHPDSGASAIQRRIANRALVGDLGDSSEEVELAAKFDDQLVVRTPERIRAIRRRLNDGSWDPIRLVDLARAYSILGVPRKAVRSMDTAVALAPNSRFVLRSAARLYVHAGELDKAHFLLRTAGSTPHDPWVLAAEIGIASMLNRSSSWLKKGIRYVEEKKFSPFDMSELACALAMQELNSANSKLARRLFKRSLMSPTENSIAQLISVSRADPHASIPVADFDVPRKYEALAISHFKGMRFRDAINEGTRWMMDQPFAVSPVLFTGITSSIIEEFELSNAIYRFGLAANPKHSALRNNLAFSLASNSEPEAADVEFRKIDRFNQSIQDRIITTATEGLIAFRRGKFDIGRALYGQAISLAEGNNEPTLAMKAVAFLAREEVYARTDRAKATFEQAVTRFRGFTSSELDLLFARLRRIVESESALLRIPGPG